MSIKINLLFNTAYQILNLIVPLITAPYLARTIGAEGIGSYAYYQSIAYYFVMFIMLGLNNYGNRTVARNTSNKKVLSETFWNIYAIQLFMGLLSCCMYVFYVLSCNDKTSLLIASINIFYVVSGIFDINWFFSGLEKFKIIVTRNSIIKLVTVFLILIFVKTKNDLSVYVFIMAISVLASQISIWPFLLKEVIWITPKWTLIKQHIVPNLLLFIPVIAVSLYKIMDKIMLGMLNTKVQVGYYENSEKIINIPQALINSLGAVMLPRMSAVLASGKNVLAQQYLRDSMQYAMFLSIGAMFGLIGISNNFVVWFLGNEFVKCGLLIASLAPTIVFNTWANIIRTQYLIPLNKDKSYISSVCAGAAVNLVVNLMLIERWGAIGAVIGTILAEFVVMLIQTVSVRKDIQILLYVKDNFVFMFSGFVMCLVISKLANLNYSAVIILLLQLVLGVIIYVTLSFIQIKIINKKRLDYILENIFLRKRGAKCR